MNKTASKTASDTDLNKTKEVLIPEIPDFIPENFQEYYQKLAARLIELEIITEDVDFIEFNMMFFNYILAVDSMAAIQEKGTFQKDRHILRKNPAVQIFKNSSGELLKYVARFGLFKEDRENLITSLINTKIYQNQQLRHLKYSEEKNH